MNSGFNDGVNFSHNLAFMTPADWARYERIRVSKESGRKADPNNDEFACDDCGAVGDIEDSVRDRRTGKLFCVPCAELATPLGKPRVPLAYREQRA